MRVMSTVVLCAVGLLGLELSAAQADPVAPFRRVVANHCITPPCLATVTDGSPLNLSETITAADGSKLVSNISAVSTFGELSALASAELDRVTLGTGVTFVSAQMTDALTVDFASLIGSIGFLVVNYTLDGSITKSGIVNNEAQVAVLVDRDGFGTEFSPRIGTAFIFIGVGFVCDKAFYVHLRAAVQFRSRSESRTRDSRIWWYPDFLNRPGGRIWRRRRRFLEHSEHCQFLVV